MKIFTAAILAFGASALRIANFEEGKQPDLDEA